VLLWAVVVEPTIEYLTTQFHGVVLRIYDALPDASTNALVNLYDHGGLLFGAPVQESQVAPATAFLTLGLYAVVFLTIPATATRRLPARPSADPRPQSPPAVANPAAAAQA
jgi:hypothetical protein